MRKTRLLREGAKYHVMANKGEKIFESNVIKEMFLDVTGRAKSKFKFQVYNFCIMGNHIHFIMRPAEKESLSRIMQWILSVFAVKYNKTFEFKGHVWYDRFKSVLIGNLIQFLRAFVCDGESGKSRIGKARIFRPLFLFLVLLRLPCFVH